MDKQIRVLKEWEFSYDDVEEALLNLIERERRIGIYFAKNGLLEKGQSYDTEMIIDKRFSSKRFIIKIKVLYVSNRF
jgi:hypothetical protein